MENKQLMTIGAVLLVLVIGAVVFFAQKSQDEETLAGQARMLPKGAIAVPEKKVAGQPGDCVDSDKGITLGTKGTARGINPFTKKYQIMGDECIGEKVNEVWCNQDGLAWGAKDCPKGSTCKNSACNSIICDVNGFNFDTGKFSLIGSKAEDSICAKRMVELDEASIYFEGTPLGAILGGSNSPNSLAPCYGIYKGIVISNSTNNGIFFVPQGDFGRLWPSVICQDMLGADKQIKNINKARECIDSYNPNGKSKSIVDLMDKILYKNC